MNKRRLRGRPVSRSARSGRPPRAPRAAPARTGLEVWKRGGASLADANAVRRAVGLVQKHAGDVIVVVSALKGVTDALLDGARRAATGDVAAASTQAAAFLRRHRALVLDLIPPGPDRRRLLSESDRAAREYREICRAVAALGHLSPRTSDVLVARGERVAASVVAATLSAVGRRAARVDALDVVSTDGHHGAAAPDLAATRRRARKALPPLLLQGVTPVVPGFFGRAPDGTVATLGRGGTDLTATLLGRVLGASRVVLWKELPGILTADPGYVADARLIPQLHYREAAEVAYFGAKVLHPRALIPLDGSRVQLHVRSFLCPEAPGTEVSARRTLTRYPVKTRLSLSGPMVVARDIAHAKIKERLDAGEGMPGYLRDHCVYYAGPAKTPEGMPSGSFGPTTAGRMDAYVEEFQAAGGSMVMLAKGNRSRRVTDACAAHGGFYLGSIGGPAARLAQDCIRKVEVLEYPELGMEAVWRIEVEDFPAFVVVDDKGHDFFDEVSRPVDIRAT